MDTGWGRGCGMNWEICIGIYTLPCVKQRASGTLPDNTGSSAQRCVMTKRGGMQGGREAQDKGDAGWEGGSRQRGYLHTES